jgi:hypothetical protein
VIVLARIVAIHRKEHAGLGGEPACAARQESGRNRLKRDDSVGQLHRARGEAILPHKSRTEIQLVYMTFSYYPLKREQN